MVRFNVSTLNATTKRTFFRGDIVDSFAYDLTAVVENMLSNLLRSGLIDSEYCEEFAKNMEETARAIKKPA